MFEDKPSISLAEMGERHAIRECPPLLGIKPFQQRNCRQKRVVAMRRAKREGLKKCTNVFVDGRVLFGCHGQRRCLVVVDHRLKLRLHPKQPVPTDFLVENIQCVPTIVVGGLQCGDRI
ncbi:hypothetical protein D3C87_1323900 [compost metagenome]